MRRVGFRRPAIDHHGELYAIFSIAYPRQYFYEYSAARECVSVSRGAVQTPKGRDMLEPARVGNSTLSAHLLAPCPASHHSSLVTHHCQNQSLAKHNRKPSQLIENNHQRPKSIASFCRASCGQTIPTHYIWGCCTASETPTCRQAGLATARQPHASREGRESAW